MLFWKLPRLICKNDEALRKAGVLALMYWSLKKEYDSMEVQCTEKKHDWPSNPYIWFYKIACVIFFFTFQLFNGISLFQQQCKRVQWLQVKILKKITVPLTSCLPWKEILVIYFIVLIDRSHFSYWGNAVVLGRMYCSPILRNDDSIGFFLTPPMVCNFTIKGVNTHWKIRSDPFFIVKKFTW